MAEVFRTGSRSFTGQGGQHSRKEKDIDKITGKEKIKKSGAEPGDYVRIEITQFGASSTGQGDFGYKMSEDGKTEVKVLLDRREISFRSIDSIEVLIKKKKPSVAPLPSGS